MPSKITRGELRSMTLDTNARIAKEITDASAAKDLFVNNTIVDISNNIITTAKETSSHYLYYPIPSPYFDECFKKIIDEVKTVFDVSVSVITLQISDFPQGGAITQLNYIKNDYIDGSDPVTKPLYVTYTSEEGKKIILDGILDEETGALSGGTNVTSTIDILRTPYIILVEWS